jgi:hypothetical protein
MILGVCHFPERALDVKPIFDIWLSGLPSLFLWANDLCRFTVNEAENVVP